MIEPADRSATLGRSNLLEGDVFHLQSYKSHAGFYGPQDEPSLVGRKQGSARSDAVHRTKFLFNANFMDPVMPDKLTCPHCGEHAGVRLVWGDPDDATREAARRGEIVLAGCMIEPLGGGVPDYACLACAFRWSDQ